MICIDVAGISILKTWERVEHLEAAVGDYINIQPKGHQAAGQTKAPTLLHMPW
jgi:hypothetical protein